MAKLLKLANAQYPITAVFDFSATDTMVNTSGAEVAFGKTTSGTNTTYDIFTPPPNAVVVGGRVIVVTAFNSSGGNTVDVGDSDDLDRYTEAAAINMADPDAPATGFDMLGDGKVYAGNQNIRLTITNTTDDATAGRVIVAVDMVIPGRANENLKTT
ncbi:MAG TPA: hypothetical protein VD931_22810 [Baekduia sp.]|nr:hypothetical protein [Baekduia sp.]